MEVLSTLAALLAVVVLIIVVGSVLKRGFPALIVDFFTKSPAPFGADRRRASPTPSSARSS